MATKGKISTTSKKFRHPSAGNVQQEYSHLAIMWALDATSDKKSALMKERRGVKYHIDCLYYKVKVIVLSHTNRIRRCLLFYGL